MEDNNPPHYKLMHGYILLLMSLAVLTIVVEVVEGISSRVLVHRVRVRNGGFDRVSVQAEEKVPCLVHGPSISLLCFNQDGLVGLPLFGFDADTHVQFLL